jgi:hypothetical protein
VLVQVGVFCGFLGFHFSGASLQIEEVALHQKWYQGRHGVFVESKIFRVGAIADLKEIFGPQGLR